MGYDRRVRGTENERKTKMMPAVKRQPKVVYGNFPSKQATEHYFYANMKGHDLVPFEKHTHGGREMLISYCKNCDHNIHVQENGTVDFANTSDLKWCPGV